MTDLCRVAQGIQRLVIILGAIASTVLADDPGRDGFARRAIDSAGPKDPWFKLVGDVNSDGQLDIIVAGQHGPLVAYLYPEWTKIDIAGGGFNGVDGAVGDLNGDGRVDIVLGGIVWFENPSWKLHRIDDFTAHDVQLADLDRDGRLDVIARDQSGFGHNAGNHIHIYQNDRSEAWSRRTIECPHGEGLAVADVNADGNVDLVIAGQWYENPGMRGDRPWNEHTFSTRWTHSDVKVAVADLNADGRPDIVLTPAEPAGGASRVCWYEAPEDPEHSEWIEHVIISNVESVLHGLAVGDVNGDGAIDIVTAAMHQGSEHPVQLLINHGRGATWQTVVLSSNGSHNIKMADIGHDGDLDIVGANWSGPYQPIELWENLSHPLPRNARADATPKTELVALVQEAPPAGLATMYPGDMGIAKDPSVVFAEDFEEPSIDVLKQRWETVTSAEHMTFSKDLPSGSGGSQSLLMTHIGGKDTGGHLYRRLLPGHDQLYARFYVKFDRDCVPLHHFGTGLGGYNPSTPWPQGGAGVRPDGNERFLVDIEPFGESWVWDYYTYWCEMGGSPPRGQTWGNSFIRDPQLKVARGQWVCVESMVKMNDVGQSNGELALWIDGKQVSHLGQGFPKGKWVFDKFIPGGAGEGVRWNDDKGGPENFEVPPGGEPFKGFRWRTAKELNINFLWLYVYITQAPAGHVSRIGFDDVVIATKYIGPIKPKTP
jgi:hypothetical protein